MATAKRDNSTHIRLSDEADAIAELIAESTGKTKTDLLTKLLERTLLGEAHLLRLAAMRFARSGLLGSDRE